MSNLRVAAAAAARLPLYKRGTLMVNINLRSLGGLNEWKQRGFYVGIQGNAFVTPCETLDRKYSETVYHFAWRAISTLDFVLKDGNLERYIAQARSIRDKLA